MIIPHHHTDNMRRDQPDKADKPYVRYDHRSSKAAQHHIHKNQPADIYSKTHSCFTAA